MANVQAEATGLPERQTAIIDFSFRINGIALVLAAGLALRLVLATLPGFGVDVGTFQAWSMQLADNHPWNFYKSTSFTDYTPGFLYVLWLIGWLNEKLQFSPSTFEYVIKLPSVIADLASAYLLYRLLYGQKAEVRLGAAALYLLFPAALLIGPIWGQVDSILAFFLLLSVYFIARGRPVAGSVAFVAGFVIKPQAIGALPFLAFWIMRQHPPRWTAIGDSGIKLPLPPRLWLYITGASFAVILLLILPFFTDKPWDLFSRLQDSANVYPYSSINAYSFWGIWGFWKRDDIQYWGVDHTYWGLVMFAVSVLAVVYTFRRSEGTGMLALGTALSILAFNVFVTRMHERYLFPMFLPFLAACVFTRNPLLWAIFAALGVLHFFNLYYAYAYYNPNELRWESLFEWVSDRGKLFSLLVFLSFPISLVTGYMLSARPRRSAPT